MEERRDYHHRVSKSDNGEEGEALLEGGKESTDTTETETLMSSGHQSSNAQYHHHYQQIPAPLLAKWRKSHTIHSILNFFLTAVLLCSIAFVWLHGAATGRQSSTSPDVERYHYYSPALEATKHGSRVTHFNHTKWSPFSPSRSTTLDDVNGNWTAILRTGMMSLTETELHRTGASPDSVRLPPSSSSSPSGPGYLAYLASHHHLHCLYLLHQSLHPDHYADFYSGGGIWAMTAERRLSHWDHCVEALRQYVVCEADSTVVTHNWFEGYDAPVASQENPRKCADWEAHFQWQAERQVAAPDHPAPDGEAQGHGHGVGAGPLIEKPAGAVERPVMPADPPPGFMSMYVPSGVGRGR